MINPAHLLPLSSRARTVAELTRELSAAIQKQRRWSA
jgi:hypothetical protein